MNDEPLLEKAKKEHGSGESPGESNYYNRAFWASYKGYSRGLLGGLLLGAGLGLAIGGVVALALAPFITSPMILGIIGTITATGALYGKEVFSIVGANAGAISSAMEINQQHNDIAGKKIDKILSIIAKQNDIPEAEMSDLQNGINDINKTNAENYLGKLHPEKPLIFTDVSLVGAAAGVILGGALLATGVTAVIPAIAIIGGSIIGGASYGINRHYFKEFFNVTNALYDGDMSEISKQQNRQDEVEIEKIAEIQKERTIITPDNIVSTKNKEIISPIKHNLAMNY